MSLSTISIRVNSEDKLKFEDFCNKTGLNTSSAINMYIKAVLMNNKIPFEIKTEIPVSKNTPNAITKAALSEADQIANSPSFRGYKDMKSLRAALEV